jgi:hypothetical protein
MEFKIGDPVIVNVELIKYPHKGRRYPSILKNFTYKGVIIDINLHYVRCPYHVRTRNNLFNLPEQNIKLDTNKLRKQKIKKLKNIL